MNSKADCPFFTLDFFIFIDGFSSMFSAWFIAECYLIRFVLPVRAWFRIKVNQFQEMITSPLAPAAGFNPPSVLSMLPLPPPPPPP